jgi:uncharacterized lipoprotein YddW (UPF0748 family)
MTKRDFLLTLGIGGFSVAFSRQLLGIQSAVSNQGRKSKNWIWISAGQEMGPDDWKRFFAQMRASGIDAIIPEVYNGRHAYWNSQKLPVQSPRLEMLLPLAKAEGLEVHAWMWCLPCLMEDILKNHPDWYNVNAKGESAADKPAYVDYYRFLDPARPEVREFLSGIVTELSSFSDLTGIHLDYIRHPDAILPKGLWSKYGIVQDRVYPPYDYGYTQYSRNAFKKSYGIDPIEIKDPETNREWLQYRFDSVTDLVNDFLAPAAHAKGKKIGAAVFPGPSLSRTMVRQDWGRWHLDAFFPMLYNTFYEAGPEWVAEQTREGVAATQGPVFSGLFAGGIDPAGLAVLVRSALHAGAAGVSLFSGDSMDDAKWKSFREVIS